MSCNTVCLGTKQTLRTFSLIIHNLKTKICRTYVLKTLLTYFFFFLCRFTPWNMDMNRTYIYDSLCIHVHVCMNSFQTVKDVTLLLVQFDHMYFTFIYVEWICLDTRKWKSCLSVQIMCLALIYSFNTRIQCHISFLFIHNINNRYP